MRIHKGVFLDRDGVINEDVHYLSKIEDFKLLPKVAQAIKLLNDNNFKVIVITNQSAIARGYFGESRLWEIHKKMENELAKEGAFVDGIYYCPHHPDDDCDCRKPKPTLGLTASKKHHINLKRSFVVGDSSTDIIFGKKLGCKTVFVGDETILVKADYVTRSLLEAVEIILQEKMCDYK